MNCRSLCPCLCSDPAHLSVDWAPICDVHLLLHLLRHCLQGWVAPPPSPTPPSPLPPSPPPPSPPPPPPYNIFEFVDLGKGLDPATFIACPCGFISNFSVGTLTVNDLTLVSTVGITCR